MSDRPRVYAAIIRNNQILMVFTDQGDHSFWTLPGGGVESGETLIEAVLREVKEEVKLNGKVERLLFEGKYSQGPEYCFLVSVDLNEEAQLGEDPELLPNEQVLKEIAWFTLEEKKNDKQVSEVIKNINGDKLLR